MKVALQSLPTLASVCYAAAGYHRLQHTQDTTMKAVLEHSITDEQRFNSTSICQRLSICAKTRPKGLKKIDEINM